MFPSLGMPEIILILVIALVVFGPKQIPEVGKALGRTLNEIRRASMSGWDEVLESDKEAKKEVEEETTQPRTTATEAQKKP
ncbi:Sec-independent protein translocase protein TatAd [Pelotomaculum sp. FP]|uniref:twin-arginine translocase TatA/TatE family subunit n=1 Tax=Pelotomaculum sp. FP TaxID=261474 RepID=UPI001064FC89|nr:twin-arginine translocase TatA/TatE family subunit [Pelotomaculum sp. FP]TEB12698.1 Sec-independent protein translocase protein TatAd [Pelotomaculum sp. FP]